mmetsp:Transcript_48800/g.72504  ORF Transcript_48800/g.72504 Transcript_48800/m.72504 type:complete len:87 (+) Transcript_48800:277-537(+)
MGKDGTWDECVDFDPGPFINSDKSSPQQSDESTDFDAPMYSKEAANLSDSGGSTVLERLMLLEDECYLGKDGTLDECADFDPPSSP